MTGGWKEQLRRVAELALVGVVAVLVSTPVVTVGAVVATLSWAVAHWIEHDELPRWTALAREVRRRLLPGVLVGPAAVLVVLVVAAQVRWLGSGVVPGGTGALVAVLVATSTLLAAVLLAVPQLAHLGWRAALAAGWTTLLRVPLSGAAALGATIIAVLLGVLLPGIAFVLPAVLVLALHAVHRTVAAPPAGP
ncbi:hypothetical protein ACQEVB_30995 [Pseudonocardia sp. CA-107938]|uniref:hypothetical protein n=1 Tax=Pseudonocardia sp. CA-107938 TaxID=3240021 RepID=UPI003D903927